jgi:hypothetical protein
MPVDIFIGLVVASLLFLALLTLAAILEVAVDYFPTANQIMIVDPSVSQELERIAAERTTRPHKRFAYDRATRKAVLVESNHIADELKNEDLITVSVR